MSEKNELKIFVVDDEVFYLNMFEQYIRNLGYADVTTYQVETKALGDLHKKPDVIFLDYNMDTYTGYEVLKKIKRFNPNIYVVMISGQEEIKPAVDSLKHGAFDYIQKGDNEENKISEVITKILEVNDLMQRSKPSLLKKIFEFI